MSLSSIDLGSLNVLIVEDNRDLAANIYDFLEACGHVPDAVLDGRSGLDSALCSRYDAIVLDWTLPGLDGMSVLRCLREEHLCTTPIIMLTAKDQVEGKILGFEAGADDYLVKPVALSELEIRLRVMVGRARQRAQGPSRLLTVCDLTYNLDTLDVSRGQRKLSLSTTLRKVLELLMRESPNPVRRDRLERLIWGADVPDADLLRSYMHLLRREVDQGALKKLLVTVPGVGYRIDGRSE